MKPVLRVIGITVGGGIGTALLWWIVNWWLVAAMGVEGLAQRWWPLSSVSVCVVIGAGFYAVLGTADTVVKSRNKIKSARHADQIAELASDMRFKYAAGICSNDFLAYRNIHLFRLSQWSKAENRMLGHFGSVAVELVDYTYVVRSDEGGEAYFSQTVVLFPKCAPNLPRFQLVPVGLHTKLLCGLQGIRFETTDRMISLDRDLIEKFSSHYYLWPSDEALDDAIRGTRRGDDKRSPERNDTAVVHLFNLDLLRFFAEHPGWCVESDGHNLAVWRNKRIVPADKRSEFLDSAVRVRRAIVNASDPTNRSQIVPGEVKVDPRTAPWSAGPGLGTLAGFVVGGLLGMGIVGTWLAYAADPPMVPMFLVFFALPHIGLFVGNRIGYWLSRRKCS